LCLECARRLCLERTRRLPLHHHPRLLHLHALEWVRVRSLLLEIRGIGTGWNGG
jgi:hypothetical protein